jgi:hypothetical protein
VAAPRVCIETNCSLTADPRSQRCGWHRLARQAPIVQEEAAQRRRMASEAREGYVYRPRVSAKHTPPLARWCSGCQGFVPAWYTSGAMCKAHARIASRASRVKATYGLDGERARDLLTVQSGRCAICGRKPRAKALAVDHDHVSGAVRGYLCQRCNHDLLGAAHDSLDILRAAVAYLENPPASGAWTPPWDGLTDFPF